jgi:hypothetical protein
VERVAGIRDLDSPVFDSSHFSFRDNSIDSVILSSGHFLGADWFLLRLITMSLKAVVAAGALWLTTRVIRSRTFYDSSDRSHTVIHNAFAILPVLMLLMFPIIWVYHFVFLIPTVLLAFKNLRTSVEAFTFLAVYYLVYLAPTFDLYPVSFHRLFGVLIFWMLLQSTAHRGVQDFPWLRSVTKIERGPE